MNRLLQKELKEYPNRKTYQRMLENQLIAYQHSPSLACFKEYDSSTENWLSGHISKARKFDQEYHDYLLNQLRVLEDEVKMFESSVEALPNELRDIARALLLKGETWDAVSEQMHISRSTLARYRNHAIKILSAIYNRYEKEEIERMLS